MLEEKADKMKKNLDFTGTLEAINVKLKALEEFNTKVTDSIPLISELRKQIEAKDEHIKKLDGIVYDLEQ